VVAQSGVIVRQRVAGPSVGEYSSNLYLKRMFRLQELGAFNGAFNVVTLPVYLELPMLNRHFLMASLAALLLTGSLVPPVAAQSSADQSSAEASQSPVPPPPPAMKTDPDAAGQSRAAAAAVPSCVYVTRQESRYVQVYNSCYNQQRVKVIVAWGPDSSCLAIPSGWYGNFWWSFGRFDGLVSC
jgi:hypothetical protein